MFKRADKGSAITGFQRSEGMKDRAPSDRETRVDAKPHHAPAETESVILFVQRQTLHVFRTRKENGAFLYITNERYASPLPSSDLRGRRGPKGREDQKRLASVGGIWQEIPPAYGDISVSVPRTWRPRAAASRNG